MKVTIDYKKIPNANIKMREKELVRYYEVVVAEPHPIRAKVMNPITVRFYMGRAKYSSVVHCNVWVSGPRYVEGVENRASNGYTGSGYGKAGGGGYDKYSEAFAEAVKNAGIELDASITGSDKMREAMKAITKALGYNGEPVILEGGA